MSTLTKATADPSPLQETPRDSAFEARGPVARKPPLGEDASLACKPLLNAATKDLFRKNAFRVTGLPVDATSRDIAKRSNDLKILAELGQDAESQKRSFSLKPSPSIDEIREALQKLKDPEKRLIDEFFWFWPEKFGESSSDAAMQALAKGDLQAAAKTWMSRRNDPAQRVVATHNLALIAHVSALDWENHSLESELDAERRRKTSDYWKTAFRRWDRIATGEQLWESVSKRIGELDEPNLTTGFARRMRTTLPTAFDKINAELVVALAESGKIELARIQVQLIRDRSQESPTNIEKVAEFVLLPARNRLKEHIRQAKERGGKSPEDGINAARDLLEETRETLALFTLFFGMFLGKASDLRNDVFDEVASTCNQLQVAYHKASGDNNACLELLKTVLSFATSPELRKRIEENLKTLSENIEASGRESLYANLRPISSAPSLSTMNGCGFTLYGSTDVDAANGSYLTTYYFVFLFIPVFPICRYRVTRNGNSYRFFGKAPLRPCDKWHLGISVAVILSAMAVLLSNNSSLSSSSPSALYSSNLSSSLSSSSSSTPSPAWQAIADKYFPEAKRTSEAGAATPSTYEKSTQSQGQPTVPESNNRRTTPAVEKGTLCSVKIPANETLSIHADASADSAIVGTLKNDDHVYLDTGDVVGTRNAWRKVTSFAGVTGWVNTGFASTTTDEIGRTPSNPSSGPSGSPAKSLSEEKREEIENERGSLLALTHRLDALGREIESERPYLDHTNPYSVDPFNEKVNRYNSLLEQVKAQERHVKEMIDDYNTKLSFYGR